MKAQALLVSAMLAAGQVSAGPWTFDGYVAMAEPSPHGIVVGVVFDPSESCRWGHMAIYGNPDIGFVVLLVDGKEIGSAETTYLEENTAVITLYDDGLRSLKAGNVAAVLTDQGGVNLDLDGSRFAIDRAYVACLQELKKSALPTDSVSF